MQYKNNKSHAIQAHVQFNLMILVASLS